MGQEASSFALFLCSYKRLRVCARTRGRKELVESLALAVCQYSIGCMHAMLFPYTYIYVCVFISVQCQQEENKKIIIILMDAWDNSM